MYNEKEDFLHHKKEIDDFIRYLRHSKVKIETEMIVLDLGAGQGMHAGFLSCMFRKVYCADIINYSSLYGGEYLKLLKEKHLRNDFDFHLDRVVFNETDAMNLIYKDNVFDVVVSINSFEHILEPRKGLEEIIRVTKPKGLIYISFDPIWSADTGGHFFNVVSEPWEHLVCNDPEYIEKMMTKGATNTDCEEYRNAMNRRRLSEYKSLFFKNEREGRFKVLHEDTWSGVVEEKHKTHPNFQRCLEKGFSEEELLTRGLRYLLIKLERSHGIGQNMLDR